MPGFTHVPSGPGRSRCQKAHEVRHVAAADEQPARLRSFHLRASRFGGQVAASARQARVGAHRASLARRACESDELGNPSHGLRFDLGGHRRQGPRAAVLIDGARQEIAERPNRRGARRDVAEKPRMTIEERVVEEQTGGGLEHRAGVGSAFRQAALRVQRTAHGRAGFVRLHGPFRHPRHVSGDPIDELMPERAKFLRGHVWAGSARHCPYSLISIRYLYSFFVFRSSFFVSIAT